MQNNNFSKILVGVSIVTIILFAQISGITAANNQGLEWGIDVGDRFDYDVKVEFHNTSFDLSIDSEMYMIINALSEIPDDVTSGGQLAIFGLGINSYTTYWENGTIMDSVWLNEANYGSPLIAYPVGNWILLTEIFQDSLPSAIITQDETILNHTVVDIPNPGNVHKMVFLKSFGIPQSQFYNVTWGSETTVFVELTLTSWTTVGDTTTSGTTGTTVGEGDNTLLLILGVGTAVVIVIVVILIMRRR